MTKAIYRRRSLFWLRVLEVRVHRSVEVEQQAGLAAGDHSYSGTFWTCQLLK